MTQIEQLISKIEEKKYNYNAMLKSAEPNSENFYSCRARVALCEELLIVAKAILKKPEIKDLEKEIADYEEYLGMYESSSRDDCIGIARHFAEFGARMQKEQMMKDAVDGPFIRRNRYTKMNVLNNLNLTCDALQGFKDGQKLTVIFVPSDNK